MAVLPPSPSPHEQDVSAFSSKPSEDTVVGINVRGFSNPTTAYAIRCTNPNGLNLGPAQRVVCATATEQKKNATQACARAGVSDPIFRRMRDRGRGMCRQTAVGHKNGLRIGIRGLSGSEGQVCGLACPRSNPEDIWRTKRRNSSANNESPDVQASRLTYHDTLDDAEYSLHRLRPRHDANDMTTMCSSTTLFVILTATRTRMTGSEVQNPKR